MNLYKDKSPGDLLDICRNKFINGRTFEELKIFLDRHEVDKITQQYIFEELEKYEQEHKNDPPPKKKPIPLTPMNMVFGVALIALGLTVLFMGDMRGHLYYMALLIAGVGVTFIGFEATKIFLNFFRDKPEKANKH